MRGRWFFALCVCVACGSSESDPTPGEGSGDPSSAGTDAPAGAGGSGGSGSGAAGGGSEDPNAPTANPTDNPIEGIAISADCQGIDFENILYSPGGNNLPNICEPYDATLNNPYAVRCIDAWPWYETAFPGDEFCILPPPPELGLQFGMDPQGDTDTWFAQVSTGDMSGYQNLSDPWTLPAGAEAEANYHGGTNNPAEHNFYRNYSRMRAGSHHMINSIEMSPGRHTWSGGSAGALIGSFFSNGSLLPGAQRPDENAPQTLAKPEEDAGIYGTYPANADITFNVHHFNSTPQTILREAWINIWFEEDARIPTEGVVGLNILHPITLSVTPNTVQDLHFSFSPAAPIRVLRLFGHRHVWTTNFSAWLEKPGGDVEIVYQSFDWFDQPTYKYDSITENPAPMPEQRADGGKSGILEIQPGETLHFNCHIVYTDERAEQEGAPSPASIGQLGFANEAFTAEMCILFGASAGVNIGTPATDVTPLPSFATID